MANEFSELSNISPLAKGGQKEVFAAQHATHGDVVLKVFPPMGDPESIRREPLAMQAINLPRVPTIHDVGQSTTPIGICHWFLEQRVDGESLKTTISKRHLSPQEVLRLGLHVLATIVEAERKNIVHRDIKPGNVMLHRDGSFWVIDFGIARHLALDSITQTGAIWGKGTPGYSAPEQMRNRKTEIDSRSDLFALGVTLYESAVGTNPFRHGARDDLEILMRTETIALPPLNLPISDTSKANLRDCVSAMTQKRRDQRPRTAEEAFHWFSDVCKQERVS